MPMSLASVEIFVGSDESNGWRLRKSFSMERRDSSSVQLDNVLPNSAERGAVILAYFDKNSQ